MSDRGSVPTGKWLEAQEPTYWWVSLQLLAITLYNPLVLLVGNMRALVNTSSLIVVCMGVFVASTLLYLALRSLSVDGWKALAWVTVTVVFFWHWSGGVEIGPVPAWMSTLVTYILVMVAAGRLSEHRRARAASLAASLTLAGTMLLLVIQSHLASPPHVVGPQSAPVAVGLNDTPDIVLVVLDGYGRDDVIHDYFGHDNSEFTNELTARGFDVAARAAANYTMTHLSVAALMNMSYMHPADASIGNSDLDYLASVISGRNDVVRILKDAGYAYVHGPTISPINRCGPEVDVCLDRPLADLTTFALLGETPVGGVAFGKGGHPATTLNLSRIEQLAEWPATRSEWPQQPTFSFFHLILPHPPLFLDSECTPRIDSELGGDVVNDGTIPPDLLERRKAAWIEQLECANRMILGFLDHVDDDDVIVVLSDHGPDSVYVHGGDVATFTNEQLEERLPTLTAIRLPQGCPHTVADDVTLVNVFRVVFSCLSDSPVDLLADHYYIAGFGGLVAEFKDFGRTADEEVLD